MSVDQALEDAVAAVWRIPAPGPKNILYAPAFVALSELCSKRYGSEKATFGLHNVLQSLGLPCGLPVERQNLALDVGSAAEALDAAYRRGRAVRRHLCPLDLAADLPPLTFGGARVKQFSAEELTGLFDAPRLTRVFPQLPFELSRLAQFHWLVVEEDVELDPRPEARAVPVFYTDMSRDLGEIEPLRGRFPPAVERALFFLLLAPWEDWSTMEEVEWRGFRAPWIYTIDEDLFVRPPRPPSPDSLTLQPLIVQDAWGDEIELEEPTTLRLEDRAKTELALFDDGAWSELQAARATPLFATPLEHFLVRAFLADGVDEVMAHMTAIEAALGLESDHKSFLRPKPDPHKRVKPTRRVAARIAAALSDPTAARRYEALFEIRSAFVHGRAGVQKISTAKQVLARRLARQVVYALVSLAGQSADSRENVLASLLTRGLAII